MNISSEQPRSPFYIAPGRGQTLVEFAVALPLLLLLMTVIIQLGMVLLAQMIVSNAAWIGARAGATVSDPARGDQEIIGAVVGASPGLDSDLLSIDINPAQDEFPRDQPYPQPRGAALQVQVTYPVNLVIPDLKLPVTGKGVAVMEYQNP